MIHEEICTYEVCKLAKEKGFNEYVEAFYAEDCNTAHTQGPEKWNEYKGKYAASTQSLLQRWLRENHGADVWVDTAATMDTKNQRCYYWHIAYDSDGSCIYILDSMLSHPTYEKALEEGLKEAMIEFVEERK